MAKSDIERSGNTTEDLLTLEKDVGFPKRYVLALMIFLGFSVLYALRVNLNVAIGAMCNNHTIYENGFYVQKVKNIEYTREVLQITFLWSIFEISVYYYYFSSYFYVLNFDKLIGKQKPFLY